MIEIKVAAKEAVKLSFGGSPGWPLVEYCVTSETMKLMQDESDQYMIERDRAREHGNGLATECAKLREDNEMLQEKLTVERQSRRAPTITLAVPLSPLPVITADQVRDAIKEAVGRRLAPTWEPIETAPKDGVSCLVWDRQLGEHVAKWSTPCQRWCIAAGDGFSSPTHWMPLPEPPK